MSFIVTSTGGTVDTLPVPYSVMEDSGIREAYPESGPTATVKFQTSWANHYKLVEGLLGQWNGTPPNTFVYIGPFAYPVGGTTSLFCTSVSSIEGLGKPIPDPVAGLPWLVKENAIVTAQFSRPPYQPATSGGYFKVTFNASGEFFTLPETTYRFSDGTPTNTPIGIVLPQAEITVTRYKMPFLPDVIAVPLIGMLNNSAFQIGFNTYAMGTLLFGVGASEVEADVFGNLTFQFEYKFMYRPVDWNYYFHPNRSTGWALVTDGNGNPPYSYGDFGVLP